jgi:hypothetical protein
MKQGCWGGIIRYIEEDRTFEVDDTVCADGSFYHLEFNDDLQLIAKKMVRIRWTCANWNVRFLANMMWGLPPLVMSMPDQRAERRLTGFAKPDTPSLACSSRLYAATRRLFSRTTTK